MRGTGGLGADRRSASRPPCMSDSERILDPSASASNGGGDGATVVPLRPEHGDGAPPPPRRRVRIRKLRLFALLLGLGVLAAVSTVFGMMMAVASDLPTLDRPATRNSVLVDRDGNRIGLLTGNQQRLFLREEQIAPVMKQAIIAIEDQRFYTNDGVDLRGIGRALYQDIVQQRVVQGGSTITQQFVKNALAAQDERTIFQKLRESAMAYHLTRKWTKEEILRNYLNTIYFGNGAYGIEAAARTYFQARHPGCDEKGEETKCAAQLLPHEAALLAGMVASPTGYDPIVNPDAARDRRDTVLQKMLEQDMLTQGQYDDADPRAAPRPRRPPAAGRGGPVPVLHLVGPAAGRRPARRRPGGRAAGVRGRPEGGDDDRRRDAGRRPERGRPVAPVQGGPARRAGGAREQVRRGARHGRRRRLQRAAVQPRHPGPAPARLVDQAVHPRRGAAPGHLDRLRVVLAQAGDPGAPLEGRDLHRQQLRGRVLGDHHARARDDVLGQLGVRPGGHQGGNEEGRAACRADGHPYARVDATTR